MSNLVRPKRTSIGVSWEIYNRTYIRDINLNLLTMLIKKNKPNKLKTFCLSGNYNHRESPSWTQTDRERHCSRWEYRLVTKVGINEVPLLYDFKSRTIKRRK